MGIVLNFISKASCEDVHVVPAVWTSFKLKSKQALTGGDACVTLKSNSSSEVNFLEGRLCAVICTQRFKFNTNPTGDQWNIVKYVEPTAGLQVDAASLTVTKVKPLSAIADEHLFEFF